MHATPHDLDEETFARLVRDDARGWATTESAARLRSPEVLERWHDTLVRQKRALEIELTDRQAALAGHRANAWRQGDAGKARWLEEVAAYEDWRAGALRLLGEGIEPRIAEARRLRKQQRRAEAVASFQSDAGRLREAILRHREHRCGPECDTVCAGDLELWSHLEQSPVPAGGRR